VRLTPDNYTHIEEAKKDYRDDRSKAINAIIDKDRSEKAATHNQAQQ
jgi:hypothetical protein